MEIWELKTHLINCFNSRSETEEKEINKLEKISRGKYAVTSLKIYGWQINTRKDIQYH